MSSQLYSLPEKTNRMLPADASRMQQSTRQRKSWLAHSFMWLCLFMACTGTGWFAFQVFLVPQPRAFTPDWQDARWVQATDTTSPVAYFRYAGEFDVLPDNAFVTVAASQVFRLYVNGTYIGSNTADFAKGDTPQTYMFDVDTAMLKGLNVVGLHVTNADKGIPQVRATFGVMWGLQSRYYSTGNGWLATGQATLAHPRDAANSYTWTTPAFDASQWRPAQILTQQPPSPRLMVNPLIYEQPVPTHWISTGSGAGQEGYFVRQLSLPAGFDDTLLRIVATGEADIFINDHLYMRWNGQENVPQTNIVNYLDDNGEPAPYRNGLVMGVYDITPYVHSGINTLAVHVLAPGTTTAKEGLDTLKSAMSLDMLVGSGSTYTNPITDDLGWHTSSQPANGWTHESSATANWTPPDAVGRPGASGTFYLPDSNTPRNVQVLPPVQVGEVIIWSCVAVIAAWLLVALGMLRRYYPCGRSAFEAASLIWLPALAFEALLITLTREPQLPQPFPYTASWGLALIAVVGLSAMVLWGHARHTTDDQHKPWLTARSLHESPSWHTTNNGHEAWSLHGSSFETARQTVKVRENIKRHIPLWLQHNWAVLPIILFAIPMVCYDPTYEPYWQDELSSYYAARNIMLHGFPAFPSGFIYPKGELFSYLLALIMSIFGTTSYLVPRTISMACFLVSLPILYLVGSKLFNRKVGWLATAMLALSPYAMIWSRQARMYELAQFLIIIVLFLFYQALKYRDKIRPLVLASISLLLAYFSHEEIFIILPALVTCMLVGSREGPYGFPSVLRKKHWWIATLLGSTVIMLQLAAVFLTHPLKLGTDQSQRPQLQLTTNNVPYYFQLLFMPTAPKDSPKVWVTMTPFIVVNSILAVIGSVLAFCRKDERARYCALFLIISSLTLVFVFTMQADRYYYPLLPVLYLMGAYAIWKILYAAWFFARPYLLRSTTPAQLHGDGVLRQSTRSLPRLARPVRILVMATVGLVCASVLLAPMLPLSNFNLFLSRVTGSSYHEHFADYDDAGVYMHNHLQKGDVVVTIAPAVIVLYYVGQVDDFFSVDRALFLFESNGQMVETTSGAHPLLNEADFQTVLAEHTRIWLISDNGGYQGGVNKNARFTFPPPDFRLVYEGFAATIYFRSAQG